MNRLEINAIAKQAMLDFADVDGQQLRSLTTKYETDLKELKIAYETVCSCYLIIIMLVNHGK